MNVDVLIDSIVRQTTVLIAQLGTSAGGRASLTHVANQVFLDLVRELRQQGLSNKVIADMFGLALRTYHAKVQRLTESGTEGGRSLWEAVLEYVQDQQTVGRAKILTRFGGDDPAMVKSVLKDLVDSGMVFRTGRGDHVAYRAATPDEYESTEPQQQREGMVAFVWVALNRYGPATPAVLANAIPLDEASVAEAIAELVRDGRARAIERDGETCYECTSCVIPVGSSVGWEAAVFDHFQAVVTAICTKLRLGDAHASPGDWVGGSTYRFEVWPGHPLQSEALGYLAKVRELTVELRRRVEAYNAEHAQDESTIQSVIVYAGQTVLGVEEGDLE